jgi:hypothetical protein
MSRRLVDIGTGVGSVVGETSFNGEVLGCVECGTSFCCRVPFARIEKQLVLVTGKLAKGMYIPKRWI